MALHDRHRPRPPAFVGGREFRRAAEREGRDQVDRERRGVVVVDHDGDVGLQLPHPLLRFLEAREHPLPVGLLGLVVVDRRADRGNVRRSDACDDLGHDVTSVWLRIWLSTWIWLRLTFALAATLALALRLGGLRLRLRLGDQLRGLDLAGPGAVAFDRAAAGQHHRGVVRLGRAGHHRGEVLERVPVGRAELGGEIDVAAELQHAVVVALEDGVLLRRRQVETLEVARLVGLERLAVLVLHQRHAEHVDAVALPRALGIEHERAGNVVVGLLLAGHGEVSVGGRDAAGRDAALSNLRLTYIAWRGIATKPRRHGTDGIAGEAASGDAASGISPN